MAKFKALTFHFEHIFNKFSYALWNMFFMKTRNNNNDHQYKSEDHKTKQKQKNAQSVLSRRDFVNEPMALFPKVKSLDMKLQVDSTRKVLNVLYPEHIGITAETQTKKHTYNSETSNSSTNPTPNTRQSVSKQIIFLWSRIFITNKASLAALPLTKNYTSQTPLHSSDFQQRKRYSKQLTCE